MEGMIDDMLAGVFAKRLRGAEVKWRMCQALGSVCVIEELLR